MAVINDLTVKGEGTERDVDKAESLEGNVIVACNKLFLENTERILQQAKYLGYSILDCVVCIELCHQSPFVKVKLAAGSLLDGLDLRERFDYNRSIGALTCIYKSYVFNGEACDTQECYGARSWPVTYLHQTFPGSVAPHGDWKVAQDKVEFVDIRLENIMEQTKEQCIVM